MKLFTHPRSKATTSTILDEIKIARPCPASWEAMAGGDRVRHCSECNLNVYNLSAMTRVEAEQLLLQKEGRLCVRLYRRRDGRVITQDCPHGLRATMQRATRFAGALLSALMFAAPAFTQQNALQGAAPLHAPQRKDLANLIVKALDPQGAVISGATVQVKTNDGRKIQLRTDFAGKARFDIAPGELSLEVSGQGFKTQSRKLKAVAGETSEQTFKLAIDGKDMVMVGIVSEEPLVETQQSQVTHTFTFK